MHIPYNVDAEKEILGAVMIKNDCMCEINLTADDFYYIKHKIIYKAMQELYSAGKAIDIVSLIDYCKGNADAVGGFTYLSELATSSLGLDKHKIEIVKEASNARKLQDIFLKGIEQIKDKKDVKDIVNELQNGIVGLGTEQKYIVNDQELMHKTMNQIDINCKSGGKTLGLSTHILSLDKAINGLQKGRLYVLAGRPAMGKSAMAINISNNTAKENQIAYFSTEMGEEEIGIRRISMSSFLNAGMIERGTLSDEALVKITATAAKISKYGCKTNCKSNISIYDIRNQCQKMRLQKGLDLIIVDHIGYMDMTGMGKDIREQTSRVCLMFKQMAKEFDIPIIILSQLSRACELRANKRPILSDLKESGGVEENADVVLLLYRDEYYNPDTNEKNIIECNVAKQRNGKTGIIKLAWKPEYQLVTDLEFRRV